MYEMVLKLDDIGKPAWIALMVLSFIVFWPLGLAILAFLLWSGRMGCGWNGDVGRWQRHMHDRFESKMDRWGRGPHRGPRGGFSSSGNRAFDEYREETLRKLEDEQREFRDFLERLRMAKDRSEFDQFMTDRKSRPSGSEGSEPAPQT
jgi:hypothetical protein